MRRVEAGEGNLRVELEAADAEALHGEAVQLVRELYGRDVVAVAPAIEGGDLRRIPRIGEGSAERFYRFVRELVRLADDERFLPSAARLDGGVVEITGESRPALDPAVRLALRLNRARFRFEKSDRGYRSELRFDLPAGARG
jgi:hypothetical protein